MQLSITLPPGWRESREDNPDGPPTYVRDTSEESGAFQVSWAEYSGGAIPSPSAAILQEMSEEFGEKHPLGALLESGSGDCAFGAYGMAVFSSEECSRIQVWTISDGENFIRATHICCGKPNAQEVIEAGAIAMHLSLKNEHRA